MAIEKAEPIPDSVLMGLLSEENANEHSGEEECPYCAPYPDILTDDAVVALVEMFYPGIGNSIVSVTLSQRLGQTIFTAFCLSVRAERARLAAREMEATFGSQGS